MGINGFCPDGPDIALLTQKRLIDNMKINQTPSQGSYNGHEHSQHRREAPGLEPGLQPLKTDCAFFMFWQCRHLVCCRKAVFIDALFICRPSQHG